MQKILHFPPRRYAVYGAIYLIISSVAAVIIAAAGPYSLILIPTDSVQARLDLFLVLVRICQLIQILSLAALVYGIGMTLYQKYTRRRPVVASKSRHGHK